MKIVVGALVLLIVFGMVSIVHADDPLDCPGVPTPIAEDARTTLDAHTDLLWLADKARADPITFAEGKIRYDFCYIQSHNLKTQCEIISSEWARFVGYAELFGISMPIITPEVTPMIRPTPTVTPTPGKIEGMTEGLIGMEIEPLW